MKDLAAKTGLPESRLIKAYYAGVGKTGPGRRREGRAQPVPGHRQAGRQEVDQEKAAAPEAKGGFVPTEALVDAKTAETVFA